MYFHHLSLGCIIIPVFFCLLNNYCKNNVNTVTVNYKSGLFVSGDIWRVAYTQICRVIFNTLNGIGSYRYLRAPNNYNDNSQVDNYLILG